MDGFGDFGFGRGPRFGGFNSGMNLGAEIERDGRRIRREIEEDMARSRREMDAVFHHPEHHLSHHHPHYAEDPGEQRRRAEEQANYARQEAEQLKAEAIAKEERRNVERLRDEERQREDAARREKERARLAAQKEEQRLESEREQVARATQQRRDEVTRAARRAEEARLAEERRIQAEKEAETRRIQALKEAAEECIREEQQEQRRLAVFDAHQNLITTATRLTFLELQQQINALEPLMKPIQRFQHTTKKGMPFAADGTTTLFLSILQNKNVTNELKYQLLQLLMTQKGYGEHLNLLLSSPILEVLLADAQPKAVVPNEQGILILPDPFVILRAVFQQAVASKMSINEAVEKRIYPALIGAGCAMDVFNYHYEQRTPAQTMQFLVYWRSFIDLSNPANNFYLNLMSTHKEMKDDFYKLLKADYMLLYQNNYSAFMSLIIAAGMSKAFIASFLAEWSAFMSGYDLGAFVVTYTSLITCPTVEARFEIDATILKRILVLDERAGNYLYEQLKTINASKETHLLFLHYWLAAFAVPHDFSNVKALYLALIKDSKEMIAGEDKVLEGLINADLKYGLEIFNYFKENNVSKKKLMQYMDVWFGALPNDEEIRKAYAQVKVVVQNSSLRDFRFSIRTIGEVSTEKLVLDPRNIPRTIKDEATTLKWLRYTRPGFFGIGGANARSGYDTYHALRTNVQAGKSNFEQDRVQAEAEINQKLIAAGEEGGFTFRR